IEPPYGHEVNDGTDIANLVKQALGAVRRQKLSMAFQGLDLLPQRTVLQNAANGLEIHGIEKAKRGMKASKAHDLIGIN
ncbi:glycine betaine/L-proline ABC transporter ATP-binding protein, partial [Lactobacillus paracasei]|nr:glycine betaine/L-proline ABC transporter ATP-binding protein [Lacticaseibacillus paracasei]